MRLIRNWYKLLEGFGSSAKDDGPGNAVGTLSANCHWCPYIFCPSGEVFLTGTLVPDATGTFIKTGIYNGVPYFFNSVKGFYLWWSFVDQEWDISPTLGSQSPSFWYNDVSFLGSFLPQAPYTGYGLLTGIVYESKKGVQFPSTLSRIVSSAAAGFPPAAGSIEMLVRPSWNWNDGLNHVFWDTYGGSNRRFLFWKAATNLTGLSTDNISRGTFSFAWTSDTLYHVVLNYGVNRLYINKSLAYDFSDGGLGLGSSTLYIGDRYSDPLYSFNGLVYYFLARDVALSLAEISVFYDFFVNQYT